MSEHKFESLNSDYAREFCVTCGKRLEQHPITEFSRDQYKEAQLFLRDAKHSPDAGTGIAHLTTDISRRTRWVKPDGSVWVESESLLEFPKNDYSLVQIQPSRKTQWEVRYGRPKKNRGSIAPSDRRRIKNGG